MNFTKEQMQEFDLLIGKMTRDNKQLTLAHVPGIKGVHDIVNNMSVPSLKASHDILEKINAREISGGKWNVTPYQKRKIAQNEEWMSLIYMSVVYREDLEAKAKLAAERTELNTEVNELEEENKTPEERIAEKKARLKEIKKEMKK